MSQSSSHSQGMSLSHITTYEAGVIQAAAFRALKRFTDDCLKDYGITTTQWFIIGTVSAAGDSGLRLTELSRKVGTTLSFLTNAVNLLESRGYLARTGYGMDSRSKTIYVPAEMQSRCAVIERDLRAKMRTKLYHDIDPQDLRTYIKVLAQLSRLDGSSPRAD